jgi:hypothetical protein
MRAFQSKVDVGSEAFVNNHKHMLGITNELHERLRFLSLTYCPQSTSPHLMNFNSQCLFSHFHFSFLKRERVIVISGKL